MRRPRAFTLIELLVVISIICVLLTILIPVLLSAGEAARRVSCENNLKELSLALQNYHTIRNVLPAGCWSNSRPVASTPDGYWLGWIPSILPKMEQSRIFDSFNFDVGTGDAANSTVAFTQIKTLICPTGERTGRGMSLGWMGPQGGPSPSVSTPGPSYYAACHHDVEAAIDEDNRGVMFLNSRVRLDDILDGLSSTLLVGELQTPSPLGWASGTRASLRNTGHPLNAFDGQPIGRALPEGQQGASDLSATSVEAAITEGRLRVSPQFVGGFSSAHLGDGANFAFADGSVRFLRRTIERSVYERLGSRSDGEPVDESAY
ncbi:hypothetical protein OJF2_56070 [Aquisphaera giovannonii]|uniref:DUF1559 domain-containing protein n=1 Tax=Aquisphaera giovannonii TaxID=406548 RepID=A0A5B9W8Q4_9BACT|nr:DUF1559 domain-containing protein [Aquisphaera giovannonii]QEH37022.1 hypothetical protein OJF2_56070 [Aquisphaera giovannonii]